MRSFPALGVLVKESLEYVRLAPTRPGMGCEDLDEGAPRQKTSAQDIIHH
ncbi:MAG: hypothetical protein JO050_09490, partial [Acidimicrobiia bacterium]|nr:hypothetical protein [Acidimicrobiia bacterium]